MLLVFLARGNENVKPDRKRGFLLVLARSAHDAAPQAESVAEMMSLVVCKLALVLLRVLRRRFVYRGTLERAFFAARLASTARECIRAANTTDEERRVAAQCAKCAAQVFALLSALVFDASMSIRIEEMGVLDCGSCRVSDGA